MIPAAAPPAAPRGSSPRCARRSGPAGSGSSRITRNSDDAEQAVRRTSEVNQGRVDRPGSDRRIWRLHAHGAMSWVFSLSAYRLVVGDGCEVVSRSSPSQGQEMKLPAKRAATWAGPLDGATRRDDGAIVGGTIATNTRSISPAGALGTHDASFASAWRPPHRVVGKIVILGRRRPAA